MDLKQVGNHELKEIGARIQETLEGDIDYLFSNVSPHPLLQLPEFRDGSPNKAQLLYRKIHVNAKATRSIFPWLCFAFYPDPDSGLLRPFSTHQGRFWAFFRVHSIRSMPVLCVYVSRDIPLSHEAIRPQMQIAFSTRKSEPVSFSDNLLFCDEERLTLDEEQIDTLGGRELPVQALHTYLKAPSGRLAAGKGVANLQLLQEARDRPDAFELTVTDQERREGYPESWLPELLSFPGAETLRFYERGDWYTEDGPIGWKGGAFEELDETGVEAEERFYLGSLLFYNNYQTVDRQRLVTFLLNLASVSAVLRDLRRRWPAEG